MKFLDIIKKEHREISLKYKKTKEWSNKSIKSTEYNKEEGFLNNGKIQYTNNYYFDVVRTGNDGYLVHLDTVTHLYWPKREWTKSKEPMLSMYITVIERDNDKPLYKSQVIVFKGGDGWLYRTEEVILLSEDEDITNLFIERTFLLHNQAFKYGAYYPYDVVDLKSILKENGYKENHHGQWLKDNRNLQE